jgi:hypothetical protein
MNYHIYAEGVIESLKAENAALREQLTAEREQRAALVAELRSPNSKPHEMDEFGQGVQCGKRHAADQLAALDKPAEGA